ncbi:MAG TPA: hypothetical protein P5233_17885, partial [Candidatus Paceibacterota bacterium]|nr:hypothetical protein [Candidatus Paceibacterota bacterium]
SEIGNPQQRQPGWTQSLHLLGFPVSGFRFHPSSPFLLSAFCFLLSSEPLCTIPQIPFAF